MLSFFIRHQEGRPCSTKKVVGDRVLWDVPLEKSLGGALPDLHGTVDMAFHNSRTHVAPSYSYFLIPFHNSIELENKRNRVVSFQSFYDWSRLIKRLSSLGRAAVLNTHNLTITVHVGQSRRWERELGMKRGTARRSPADVFRCKSAKKNFVGS